MIYLLIFYIVFSYAFMLGMKEISDKLDVLLAPMSFPFALGGIASEAYQALRKYNSKE